MCRKRSTSVPFADVRTASLHVIGGTRVLDQPLEQPQHLL
uniref:Uncharacterized protein n=1 Tax=Anguilla anguilla TaxID=7936 RepID=A0A0E9VG74_ANGAN